MPKRFAAAFTSWFPEAKAIALSREPEHSRTPSARRGDVQEAARRERAACRLPVLRASSDSRARLPPSPSIVTSCTPARSSIGADPFFFMPARSTRGAGRAACRSDDLCFPREFVAAGGLISYASRACTAAYRQIGSLRRKDPERRQDRPICRLHRQSDQIRAGDQSQDRQTRSASPCRHRSSPAPTRSSNEAPLTLAAAGATPRDRRA